MRLATTAVLLATGLFAADEKGYLLVIDDGSGLKFEMPVPARGGSSGRSLLQNAKGPATYLDVQIRPAVARPALSGTLSLSPSPSLQDDTGKIPLRDFTVALGDRVIVEELKAYGVPQLTLTLVEEPRDCGYGAGDVRTSVPSLVVERAYRSRGVCWIDVRNTSAKGIMAVSLLNATGNSGHTSHSFFAEGREARPLIKPGATYAIQSGRELSSVSVAVFEDDTFEGDAAAARILLDQKRGGAAFARLAAAKVREVLESAKTDEELAAALKAYAERLPEPPGESTQDFRHGWDAVQRSFRTHAEQIDRMHRVIWTEIARRLDIVAGG